MAILTRRHNGAQYILSPSHLIGRGSACALRLDNRLVSGQHAVFRWSQEGWELRDLNSSNGTFVNERRLQPGETVPIAKPATVAFGDPANLFELTDDSPPIALAYRKYGGCLYAEDGILSLPNPEDPDLIIFEDEPGFWFAEDKEGGYRRIDDGQEIDIGGERWRISLPLAWERTWKPSHRPLRIADMTLRFVVSRNEEHVEITLLHDGGATVLEPRAHGYLLLCLARERIEDAVRAELPDNEHGWMDVHTLLDKLDTSEGMLNVAICRMREQFRQANVMDAKQLIERRRTTREIRIGTGRIEIIT